MRDIYIKNNINFPKNLFCEKNIEMVPEVGIEPTHGCPYQILSLARLPVPPLRQKSKEAILTNTYLKFN